MNIGELKRARDLAPKGGKPSKRQMAVAAAVEVLAQHGARGLTHRQVDRHLDWALGSTSNYFRRRNDIFIAIAEYIIQLDIEDLALDADLGRPGGVSLELFVDRIAGLLAKWMRPAYRSRMLAGAEVLFEGKRNPVVQRAARAQIGITEDWYRQIFAGLGAADPVESTRLFTLLMSSMYVGICVAEHLPDRHQLEALVHGWVTTSLTEGGD